MTNDIEKNIQDKKSFFDNDIHIDGNAFYYLQEKIWKTNIFLTDNSNVHYKNLNYSKIISTWLKENNPSCGLHRPGEINYTSDEFLGVTFYGSSFQTISDVAEKFKKRFTPNEYYFIQKGYPHNGNISETDYVREKEIIDNTFGDKACIAKFICLPTLTCVDFFAKDKETLAAIKLIIG